MKKILFPILIAATQLAQAQQDPHYSLYVFNQLPYNPATAADRGVKTFNAQYRNQWMSLDGAPKTVHLNAQLPFGGQGNGIGIGLTSDKIGLTNTNILQLAYAYRFNVTEKLRLGLGLQTLFENYRVGWADATAIDKNDDFIPGTSASQLGTNFGVGAQLQGRNFYVGVGLPRVMATKLYTEDYVSENGEGGVQNYYVSGGYHHRLNDKLKISPAAMLSINGRVPFEAEVALQAFYMDKFGAGFNYRFGDSVDALLMYQISPKLRAGFAWDFTMSKIRSTNKGGFELMLGYSIGKKPEVCERFDDLRFF